ncbi:hypothetical protein CK203_114030 [Vitis vinifera]|uniref:Uncharacterized protein n=1 Tax=Vitis vinifera TaxID=29760 RepID=A0A438DW31_VITVI|nr:hypothetical protein CK203_114030 [Vitis vinifera]
MVKTRGGLSASPSSPTPRPQRAAMGAAPSPPVQAPAIPPSEGKFLLSADTLPGGHPRNLCHQPSKPRALYLGPLRRGPGSRVLESHPMHLSQSQLQRNLGFQWTCLPRPLSEALRQQPELRDSFRLLQRSPQSYPHPVTIDGRQGAIGARHIAEALHIPYEPVFQADFSEWSSFSQSDMVRILFRGTSTASVLTRRELPSGMLLIDVLLRANLFPLQHKVQRRGAILEALFRISEGYFFGPHHLIMTSLLHFEEKVHQKKLQRADGIPLLFPRLLCQILEHLGYPEEPRLERRRHCREDFSLDKWHHLVAYFAPQGAPAVHAPPELPRDEQIPQAQQDEILTETPPPAPTAHPSVHMPEAIHSTSPITQGAPPVVPATPAPPPSSEPTVTVSLTEFRGLERSLRTLSTAQDSIIHQMATIRAHQDQIIATQA